MRVDGDVGRWPRAADWGVPPLLLGAQLLAAWLLTDGAGAPLGQARWTGLAAAAAVAAVALVWRRAAPVPVLVITALSSAFAVVVAGGTDAPVGGIADGVALYSLAARRGRRQAVIGCLAAYAASSPAYLWHVEGPGDLLSNEVLDGVYYLGIVALGQLRRRREAARRDLRGRLARIEQEHRAAAGAERERLARDLHDVAGHHLSAVVVHSGAAARRGDPGLTREALAVAAETGREVLRSLSRLVDVVSPHAAAGGGLKELLPPLCHGLNRLGISVSLVVEGRARKLPAEVTTTAYRIVQESLTNVMRYASGAPVRVTVRYLSGTVELAVENEAPAGGGTVPALGGGRGVQGMRDRAAQLHGDLDAGPAPGGGWSVTARLPTKTASEYGAGWPETLDAVTIAFCAALPLLGFLPPEPLGSGWPPAGVALVMTVLVARAVPLWWRRRAPYAALAVLTTVDVSLAVAGVLWPLEPLALFVFACPAQLVAVYSLACYGHGARRTWPGVLIAPLPWGVGLGTALAADPEVAADGAAHLAFLFGFAVTVLVTAPVLAAVWTWGRAVAIRSRRWEITVLDAMTARTGAVVHAERARVAAGLSGTVLDRVARLARAAETGLAGTDGQARAALEVIAEQARAALADMRVLLESLEGKT
ncbi:histidine kinase [Actinomadura graeca]|uniref:sensor histidine kinase n=1 Tax=Actinomadura graeca TaxID=2750812 RepID=UPI001E432DC2|nr:histidine kinase [Actinomadura graeca]